MALLYPEGRPGIRNLPEIISGSKAKTWLKPTPGVRRSIAAVEAASEQSVAIVVRVRIRLLCSRTLTSAFGARDWQLGLQRPHLHPAPLAVEGTLRVGDLCNMNMKHDT